MPADVTITAYDAEGSADVQLSAAAGTLSVRWLGQAGFLIGTGCGQLLIDPYLSDSLARKYAGKEFAHVRMMPAPVAAEALSGVTALLCTHRHSDHMDPDTLTAVLGGNRQCRLYAPRAERAHVLETLKVSPSQACFIDAGETVSIGPGVTLEAIASAHEDLTVDAQRQHHYLGYIVRAEGIAMYHSGDCVPYAGLAERLCENEIDIALLPINGRDAFRKSRGVPGNFSFDEAVDLCRAAGIGTLICHHFGMFAFNTAASETLERAASSSTEPVVIVPSSDRVYRCEKHA